MTIRVKLRTIAALGLRNIARVTAYRLGLRTGLHPVLHVKPIELRGPFFRTPSSIDASLPERQAWRTEAKAFGIWPFKVEGGPPDWFASPVDGARFPDHDRHWSAIGDFDDGIDIKQIWELSRFDWVIAFAQHARTGDPQAITRLNEWLAEWLTHNPPYRGPNWKCGQEASIRVMHLAVAALVIGQAAEPEPGLIDLVHAHLTRIAPSLAYAIAQDNNHGTSEAAALFIGGLWLAHRHPDAGRRWAHVGRKLLEERVHRLVGIQGSFSQYSVTYHRVLLDTLAVAELWRQRSSAPPFSDQFYEKARQATRWLLALTDETTGDAPNIGANDGARLLVLDDGPYRDFRISTQRAAALFLNANAYPKAQAANGSLRWLAIPAPAARLPRIESWLADDGGFAMLRNGRALVVLRYPRFRFRPSQADALHLDLWVDSQNILRDAGTFSYKCAPDEQAAYAGVAGHNSVQFDGRDQMPRLGRFLYGAWLKSIDLPPIQESADGLSLTRAYRDVWGAQHQRTLLLCEDSLEVIDRVEGFRTHAIVRWRYLQEMLCPGDIPRRSGCPVTMSIDGPLKSQTVVKGTESRHYLQQTPISIFEAEVTEPATIRTKFTWSR